MVYNWYPKVAFPNAICLARWIDRLVAVESSNGSSSGKVVDGDVEYGVWVKRWVGPGFCSMSPQDTNAEPRPVGGTHSSSWSKP